MDMNLMMKRGKLLRKNLGNLLSHHHSRSASRGGFGLQEYEFSCSNSPNPLFSHVAKRKLHYFPCINPPTPSHFDDLPTPRPIGMLPKIDYSPEPEYSFKFPFDVAPGDRYASSPFAVKISNYSSEEEDEMEGANEEVDTDAEEFIRRFYEQLRAQSRTQLLQYQDVQ